VNVTLAVVLAVVLGTLFIVLVIILIIVGCRRGWCSQNPYKHQEDDVQSIASSAPGGPREPVVFKGGEVEFGSNREFCNPVYQNTKPQNVDPFDNYDPDSFKPVSSA
jgi:hypothetical protein